VQLNNEIRLLGADLYADKNKLKELSYWFRVLNRPNGWHYDLDHIWVLQELEKAGIMPGSTIVDAGAGQGVMQYLLAARGYNVISLDFSTRTIPGRTLGVFNVVGEGDADIAYQHPYLKFISYGDHSSAGWMGIFRLAKLKKVLLLPGRMLRYANSVLFYLHERFTKNHGKYGKVTYLRAAFHEVPLDAASVDAVVSISAIEHADIKIFKDNIKELLRLLKPKAPLLLTTSATVSDETNYHEKTSGWCFSRSALEGYFPECEIKFDPDKCARSLMGSEVFIDRLDPYYYQDKDSFCYKKVVTELPYLPVAVKVVK